MGGSVKDLIIRMLVDDKELDKFKDAADKPIKFGDALNKASGVSVAALGGIAAAAGAATLKAAELERGNDALAASLGLSAEQAAVAGEAAANAYGNAFGGSLEEVNAATAGVVSSIAGMRDASVEQLQGITEKVLTLADGFEMESGRITQVVGQMLSTGLASSAEEGLDLLTATLQRVPAAVREDIIDAADEYGPFFAQMGLSGEEAMSMLVRASEKGMYGIDKTGDAVKEFSIRATDMSTATKEAYDTLGLGQEEYTRMLLAGGEQASDAFNTIVLGLQRIEDPAAQSQAALALFGTPLEDLGTNEIPAFLQGLQATGDALGEVGGSAERMSDTMGENVATSWEGVQRRFELAAGKMGEAFLPVLGELVGGLGEFATWAGENTELITVLGGGVAVLAGGILVLNGVVKAWAAVQAIQTAAQWASNAAWLASPTTWIIAAIIVGIGLLIAAGWLLYENWDQICAWFGDMWRELGNFWDDTVHNWGEGFEEIGNGWDDMVNGLTDAGHVIGTSLYNAFAVTVNAIAWLWNSTLGQINFAMPGWLGGGQVTFPRMAEIPMLADGGVVNSATLAVIGEAGPEVVVPLDRADEFGFGRGGGGTMTADVPVELRLDGTVVARVVRRVNLREGW